MHAPKRKLAQARYAMPGQLDFLALLDASLNEAPKQEAVILPFPTKPLVLEIQDVIKPARNSQNFRITTELDSFGQKEEKYRQNVDAIRLLKELQQSGRPATDDEKMRLVRYTGWGGIPQVFDMTDTCKMVAERDELQNLLNETEWQAARSSVVNAFYTDPQVSRFMWAAIQRFGFEGGMILEPAAGVGHFIGSMPAEISKKSRIVAVEPDSISSGILAALYPDASLYPMGIEHARLGSKRFDLVIGNVPFGQYRVSDPKFDRMKLSIHDYFFAKALDLTRPGGIVAMITSSYTLDKHNSGFRSYLANQADLLAAIRLPNTAFKEIGGTAVVTDILFFRKLEIGESAVAEPIWLTSANQGVTTSYGASSRASLWANAYFDAHPDHRLGTIKRTGNHYQNEYTLDPLPGFPDPLLGQVLVNLPAGVYKAAIKADKNLLDTPEAATMPVPGDVKDGAFAVINGVLMQNIGYLMREVEADLPDKTIQRIKGLIEVRDAVRATLRADLGDQDATMERQHLNRMYDAFVVKFGNVSDRPNYLAYREDPDMPLLLALEIRDDERDTVEKSDLFRIRTVTKSSLSDHAENLSEALALSLNRFGHLDIASMSRWLAIGGQEVIDSLVENDLAYQDPETDIWVPKDEYLSGNVRQKLAFAEAAYQHRQDMERNVEALKSVAPRNLLPEEIDARLGSTWIPVSDIEGFVTHLLVKDGHHVAYTPVTASWTVKIDWSSERSAENTVKWGTSRMTADTLIDCALNQRTPTVYDVVDVDGREIRVVNQVDTAAARDKFHQIREEFKTWIWKEEERATRLAARYNTLFNSFVPRDFDGSHLSLPGVSNAVTLRQAQKDAIWRILVSDYSTLLAHAVGAGKTMTMIAAGMEAKRLGICRKPLFAVPNHMLEQFQAEFLRLYPTANILAAGKEDLSGDRRKVLLARISTGNWDGVIITHSSLEKLPISNERIKQFIDEAKAEIETAIREAQASDDSSNTKLVKQLESAKKRLEAKFETMLARTRKDGGLSFEELGVDMMFLDEAHLFKNLWFQTKMTRIAGIPQVSAQRAFDLLLKCQVVREARRDERGVVFATATPIANAVGEMFTMQRYLQPTVLAEHEIAHFDNWAANFGETVTGIEVAPDGSGYRVHTRFARYVNLPELMSFFRLVADIRTKEMLKLPEPALDGGKHTVVAVPASEALKNYVQGLVLRAEAIREGGIDPKEDNMLCVTNDGRKAALDMRLVDEYAADDPDSKVNAAVLRILDEWTRGKAGRLTQLVFCDQSTPSETTFSVYNDVRKKLVMMGVPETDIAFIHDYNTDAQKAKLFRKVRAGQVRILLGSTQKMGFGTNVQDRLVAIHHLDAPWRPADVEQRDGRILRQGNGNEVVRVYRYVTEGSFDSYSWQTLETKAKFIAQVMCGNGEIRSVEEVELAAMSYAEVKALATGNPMILEKAGVDAEVLKLEMLYSAYRRQNQHIRYEMGSNRSDKDSLIVSIANLGKDIEIREQHADDQEIVIDGKRYNDPKVAMSMLVADINVMREHGTWGQHRILGKYCGFQIEVSYRGKERPPEIRLIGETYHSVEGGSNSRTLIPRMESSLGSMESMVKMCKGRIAHLDDEHAKLQVELDRPFEHEVRLKDRLKRQQEIDALLGIGEDQGETLETEPA